MATRASIKISDKDGNFIANIYHHYDGYPEYLGQKLLDIVDEAPIVNGLSGPFTQFNGFPDLASSIVFKLKENLGNGRVYLHTEDDYGECGEDYLYEIVEPTNLGEQPLVLVEHPDGTKLVRDVLNETKELYNG